MSENEWAFTVKFFSMDRRPRGVESMTCPKCGQTLYGPQWDTLYGVLRYRCRCGYIYMRSAKDQAQGWGEFECRREDGISDDLS